jgi:hypothetical protein
MSTGFRKHRRALRAATFGALLLALLGHGPVGAQQGTPSPDYQRLFSTALARLDEGRLLAAQWGLRRAFRHAKTEAERAALRAAYRRSEDANPLSLNFGFNVAPTNNINNGTNEEFFWLGDILLVFGPESRALSGTELSGYFDLDYRLSSGPRHLTDFSLFLYGRSYVLSSESQTVAPDVSGSDYAYVSGSLSLRHQWVLQDGLGPTAIAVSLGRVEQGKEPLYRSHKISASQDFLLRRGQMSLGVSFEDQETLSTSRADAEVVETRVALLWRAAKGGLWRWTLLNRHTRSFLTTETFQEVQASASLTPNWSVLGTVPTLTLGLGAKDYEDFILSFDGRRDRSASLGLSLRLDRISMMGFSPVLNLTGTRTRSNIARYDVDEFKANLGLQSQF